ncbi:MAG: glycosyltransferase [Thermoanaerobaculia bacterium]
MILTRVIRAEGFASAMRRTRERVDEALHDRAMRMRRAPYERADVLNVLPWPIAPRFGGVQVQLRARLQHERTLRNVALLHPNGLDLSDHRRAITDLDEALRITGAKLIHLENTADAPLAALMNRDLPLIVSIHDFSLFCANPHLLEEPRQRFCDYSRDAARCAACMPSQDVSARRALSRELLQRAKAVIFPSRFLLEKHRELFDLPLSHAHVIEPSIGDVAPHANPGGAAIAYVGAVKRHKGAHLLPQLIRDDEQWHIFGGGDADLLMPLRGRRNVHIHGYYRAGELPSLLTKHRIGLTVIPSIWPETHSLVLTESWLANTPVAAFDLGAIAERIREHGGGFLTPLDSGAEGLRALIEHREKPVIPTQLPSARDAALAHAALYRS